MLLKNLNLWRAESYMPNAGKLMGEITFESPAGKVSMVLPEEHCARILALVADGLVASSREVAEELTAQIISAAPALPRPA